MLLASIGIVLQISTACLLKLQPQADLMYCNDRSCKQWRSQQAAACFMCGSHLMHLLKALSDAGILHLISCLALSRMS